MKRFILPIAKINRHLKNKRRAMSLALSVCLVGELLLGLPAFSHSNQQLPALETIPGAAEMLPDESMNRNSATELDKLLPLIGGNKKVNMQLHGVPLGDALRALAKQAGFSVVVDESVEGDVNVDLKNVTIQEALASFKAYGSLAYAVEGKSLIVARSDSERAHSFLRAFTQIIPLQNANAKILAQILNQSFFGSGQQQQNQGAQHNVGYDYHTNSLVVVGTANYVQLISEHVRALDMPRESRTWRLSHGNAVEVASMLSSSLFNEGIPSFMVGGSSSGGASSGSGGGAAGGASSGGNNYQASTLDVQQERIQEASQTSTGGSSGGGTGTGSSTTTNITLRARVKEDQRAQISAQGPIIIPDSRLNTVTLMGTTEQIAMAEALMPMLDRKVPQVVLETSVIELTEKQLRVLEHHMGGNANEFLIGSNNQTAATPRSNSTGILTQLDEVIFGYTTNPIQRLRYDFQYQLNILDRQEKLKLIANPTVVTAHDNEAVISIVDEIIRRNELTVNAAGDLVGSEAEIGDVGVVLNILPKIGANGTISLRVRPTVSTIFDRRTGSFDNNVINLVSKRELLVQNVVMKDGESFILGGLMNNTDVDSKAKIPGIGNIPIIGQLGRSNTRQKRKTELIIVITPHILNDESDMTRANAQAAMYPTNIPDPNKKMPDGEAFLPVSGKAYRQNSTDGPYLPMLQQPQALDNKTYPQNSPQSHHSGSHKLSGASPNGFSTNMMMIMEKGKLSDEGEKPQKKSKKKQDKTTPEPKVRVEVKSRFGSQSNNADTHSAVSPVEAPTPMESSQGGFESEDPEIQAIMNRFHD